MPLMLALVDGTTNQTIPLACDPDGRLMVAVSGMDGLQVNIGTSVEVSNDEGSPIPVAASGRNCTGRATYDVTTGAAVTLATIAGGAIPAGSVAARVQADGGTLRMTSEGTAPTATLGFRLDDGVFYDIDTALANIKFIAQSATTKIQVGFYDKA